MGHDLQFYKPYVDDDTGLKSYVINDDSKNYNRNYI